MSRYSSIVGFPYAAGIGPYNFDEFVASVTVISENNAPNPTVNIVVQTHGIKTNYPLFWSTETVPGSATISANHFTDNTLTGSFNVDSSGMATITRTARADSTTNGVRIFKIVIRLGNAINGGVMKKSVEITMNDTSLTPLTATLNASVPNPIVQVINVPGRTWELFLPAVTGGRGSDYAYAAPSLPINIGSIDPVTGRLSGTPTVTSTTPTSYTVNVTQNYDPAIPFQFAQPASISFNMAVASTLTSARKDVADGETRWLPPSTTITPFIPVQASGGWTGFPAGTLPYNYTFTLNSIPAGLSFNSATGEITGSASATNALTYSVRVEDNATDKQRTTGIQFTMRVATVKATTVNVDNRIFVIGTPISFKPITYTSTAPTASYTMAGDNNVLMDSVTGFISGNPTAVQASKAYTVTIRDICRPFQEIATPFNMGFCAILTVSANVTSNRYVAVNDTITNFTPITHTGGHNPVTKTLAPATPTLRGTLTLNATTGEISGVAPATMDTSMITYTIRTIDSSTGSTVTPTRQQFDRTFKLQVVSLLVASQNVPNTRVILINTLATSLNYFPVTAGSTGSPVKTYIIKPATTALPTGLTLSSSGQITGTPTVATNPQTLITYTVRVTDECLPVQSKENTFTLAIAPTLTVSIFESIIYIKVGTATTFKALNITGGWLPLSVTPSVTLPGTLVIAQDRTGIISGTAGASVSTSTITFTVVDSTSAPQTQSKATTTSLSLRTVAALTGTSAGVTRIFAVGTPIVEYAPLSNVQGGGGTRTYATTTLLPTGISFSLVNNGFLTGTPSVTTSNTVYNITVTDQSKPAQTLGISPNPLLTTSIQVVSVLAVTANPSIPVLTEGTAFTTFSTVTATGGTTTKTYNISPALSNGLVFNTSNGQITGGTPTTTFVRSVTTYTVTVTDNCTVPQVKTAQFTLTIRAVAQLTFEGTVSSTPTRVSWVVPAGVTSISAIVVGGGGGGGTGRPSTFSSNSFSSSAGASGGGGGGGGLSYKNNIAVTSGQTLFITVGQGGLAGTTQAGFGGGNTLIHTSNSTDPATAIVSATGGTRGDYPAISVQFNGQVYTSVNGPNLAIGGTGGAPIVGTGFAGGKGGNGYIPQVSFDTRNGGSGSAFFAVNATGGGGAGGYAGVGGGGGNGDGAFKFSNGTTGTDPSTVSASAGAGGGGGGGSEGTSGSTSPGGRGGGVMLLGQGTNGAAGTTGAGGTGSLVTGGVPYGAGGSGGSGVSGSNGIGLSGGVGGVRIMWGPGRAYPSTGVADQFF
jgi:hypothetical protein